jgi:5-methylcytosine-specific restriction endonuclease McrA
MEWDFEDLFPAQVNRGGKKWGRDALIQVWNNEYEGAKSGECPICGRIITPKIFQMGHKVSKANGGSDKIQNLRPICGKCNREMSSKNWRDFVKEKEALANGTSLKKKPKKKGSETTDQNPFNFFEDSRKTPSPFTNPPPFMKGPDFLTKDPFGTPPFLEPSTTKKKTKPKARKKKAQSKKDSEPFGRIGFL